jgi:protein TonB
VQGVPHRSESELKAEIAAQPESMRAYFELVQLYRFSNRIEEAEELLRAAIARSSNPSQLFALLVSLYSPVYHPEKVLSIAEEWARAAPGVRPLTTIVNAHLELAKRLRPTSRQDALRHLDDASRAAEEARAISEDDMFVLSARANVARTRAEFEPDPATRAQLLREAEELMMQARTHATRTTTNSVAWSSSSPPPAPGGVQVGSASGAMPLRVGGNIRPPAKTKDVRPAYPPEAQQARVQGVVIAEVTVGEDGRVIDARVVRSIPMLDQAALDAVRQWEFEPTLLNGRAVPIIMTVTVQFSMM